MRCLKDTVYGCKEFETRKKGMKMELAIGQRDELLRTDIVLCLEPEKECIPADVYEGVGIFNLPFVTRIEIVLDTDLCSIGKGSYLMENKLKYDRYQCRIFSKEAMVWELDKSWWPNYNLFDSDDSDIVEDD